MKKRHIQGRVKEIQADKKTVTVIASSAAVDREGESLDPNGWVLDNFLTNPQLLWSHDAYALPIGKVVRVWLENGNLMAETQFAEEESEFAAEVARLVRGGYLNAVSVGFLPLELNSMGQTVKQELLELSYVNIPANQEAVVTERTGDKNAKLVLKSFGEKEQAAIKSARKGMGDGSAEMNYPSIIAGCVATMNEISKQIQDNSSDAAMTRGLLDQMASQINIMADCVYTWRDELGFDAASAGKTLKDVMAKAGRIISEKNRNEIRLMVDACKQAADSGQKLLDSSEPPEKKGDELLTRKAVVVDGELRALRIADRAVEVLIQRRKEALSATQNGGDNK